MLALSSSVKPRKLRTQSWNGGTLNSVRKLSSPAWKLLGEKEDDNHHPERHMNKAMMALELGAQQTVMDWFAQEHTLLFSIVMDVEPANKERSM